MAAGREWHEGIVNLWPTVIFQRKLGDADGPNRDLLRLINALDREHQDLTTDYLASDLFNKDDPAVNWLRSQVNQTVIGYLRQIGIDYEVNWTVQGWPNVNRLGDYHDYHNHPRAYLSGTYYVKMPKYREKLKNRNDLRPGCITLYDPRPGVNMNAIKGDPYVDPEYTVLPEPGMLLMWPAFINHFAHPNLSKETRVSVSFNIVLKWADHYLPEQG